MGNKFKAFSGKGQRLGGNEDGYRHLTPNQAAGRAAQSRALYQPQNVVGVTGNPNANPTVYYQQGDTFGHITSAHSYSDNVGREPPRSDPTYTAANSGPRGQLQESTASTGVFHTSRNPMDTSATARNTPTVRGAHDTHTGLKGVADPQKRQAVFDNIKARKPPY